MINVIIYVWLDSVLFEDEEEGYFKRFWWWNKIYSSYKFTFIPLRFVLLAFDWLIYWWVQFLMIRVFSAEITLLLLLSVQRPFAPDLIGEGLRQ